MEPTEPRNSITYMKKTKLHPSDLKHQLPLIVTIDVTLVKPVLLIFVLLVPNTEKEHQIAHVSTDISKPKDLKFVKNVLFNV